MAKTTAPLLPSTSELLQRLGERLRLARLRRRLTAKQVAERAGMAPMTLRSLERGGAGVTMGAYLSVMQVLGIEKDLDLLGVADPLGRELQDARLTTYGTTSVRNELSAPAEPVKRKRTTAVAGAATRHSDPGKPGKPRSRSRKSAQHRVEKNGFSSARILVDLLNVEDTEPPKRSR
jgi:transcriptional regulator with XRE-family HTH domain